LFHKKRLLILTFLGTGDEPAITRHQSRFQLDERHELIDTPGLMPPAIQHASDGLMLAASHLIGPDAYLDEEVATFLADLLLERYPGLLRTRYGFEVDGMDGYRLISRIAGKRGGQRRPAALRESRARAHARLPQRTARPGQPRDAAEPGVDAGAGKVTVSLKRSS
jgi:ribosome biogenesis GTPase A